jgi:hypothetical protein
MPQYILSCNHPHVADTDPDPDETCYEIVFRREEHIIHIIPTNDANDDGSALKWVDNHTKEEVCCRHERVNPRPLRLVKILRQW